MVDRRHEGEWRSPGESWSSASRRSAASTWRSLDTRQDEKVSWRVVDGPEEWVGTTIDWDLRQDGDWTIVNFAHQGWREPVEFMHHCSTKWATFLLSLKSMVETGEGSPAPHDPGSATGTDVREGPPATPPIPGSLRNT